MSDISVLSVNANVEFLGADLVGLFETKTDKKEDGGKETETTETKLLVMPTNLKNDGIKLTKIVKDINDLVNSFSKTPITGGSLNEENVKKKMEQFGLKIFENININLRQAFLYQDTLKKTTGENVVEESKVMEYAINIEITDVLTLPEDFKLFNIKSIGLAIWNTKREKILNQMSISNIDTLLLADKN